MKGSTADAVHEARSHPQEPDHHLAADRTDLSNERTLLAYIRTGLTLAGVGATFIRFFGNLAYSIVGWVFIVAGAVALAVGVIRFRQIRGRIRWLRARTQSSELQNEE